MSTLSAFFASIAAALGIPADEGTVVQPVARVEPAQAHSDPLAIWYRLAQQYRPAGVAQVRIERHIIWRVAPMPGPVRENMTALVPTAPRPPQRLVERRMSDCIAMNGIAGLRPQGNSRLLLFLRDRRLVAANLEKSCSAREFYRGFYVDKPNADGRLCADRDRILARSGARCEISSFRLLVPED